jgi:hypothetical protein
MSVTNTWDHATYQNTFDFHYLAACLLSNITLSSSTLHVFTACYFDGLNAYNCHVVQTVSRRPLISSDQVRARTYTCENLWRTKWQCDWIFPECIDFPLSISFHQFSILLFIFRATRNGTTNEQCLGTFQQTDAYSEISEHQGRKALSMWVLQMGTSVGIGRTFEATPWLS